MSKKHLLRRFLSLPFIMCIFLIHFFFVFLNAMRMYILFGGETSLYTHKNEHNMIRDIYTELVNRRKDEKVYKGSELIFIAQVNRDGHGTTDVKDTDWMNNDEFRVKCLSMSEKTFIAHGFNSFVVRIKEEAK